MSVKVSSWVWHGEECADLAGNEMILLLALADVADDNGRCRYLAEEDDLTYGGLARKVRVDRRTIERLIPKLRKQGLLTMQRGSKSKANEFTIVVPWAAISTDKVSANESGVPRHGGNIPRQQRQDSPTNDAPTPLYRRKDVRDVNSSDVARDALPSDYDPEVFRLCGVLAEAVKANGHKVGQIGKTWWAACDRLMRLDGYTANQVEWMIRWATSDEFWSTNIRSMPTLREKFSTLKAQAMRQANRRRTSNADERFLDGMDRGARLQAIADEQEGLSA